MPAGPLLLFRESDMSSKRATPSFKPLLERLENRITPTHHKNIPTLVPSLAEGGGGAVKVGHTAFVDVGWTQHLNSVSGTQTAVHQSLSLQSSNFGAGRSLVTSGQNGSLSAAATLTTTSNDCGRPSASNTLSNPI